MGSPFWQGVIFFVGAAFLLYETWRGWRAGLVRSGLQLLAIVASTMFGIFAAQVAAAPFGGLKQVAGLVAGCVVGGGLGFAVFFLIWLLGAVLFKRTAQQSSGIFRFFWGAGGAVFGFLMGIVLLWGGISIIRSLGAMAEVHMPAPAAAGEPSPTPPKVAAGLVTLKDSLELGPAGKFVESVDVLPPDFYELLIQIARVTGDQETMLRFLQYPGVQEIMKTPRMTELVNDPDIIKAAEKKDYLALLTSKSLLAAVEDKALADQLSKIDLRAALKFALEKPSPTPAHATPVK